MEVMKAIEARRSIRKYRPDPVEPEKLVKIAEAFRLAPSAMNTQNWKLLIVSSTEMKQKLEEALPGDEPSFITTAPVVLVGVGHAQDIMFNSHRVDSVDVSIAMSFVMLEACELGLGTCWIGYYEEPKLRAALGLSDSESIIAITPLGYADEAPEARPRKPVEAVIEYI
ncbi:MAG: nitroreductase family protein [Defluviitaleaceae bacterium]|nr:nitroreductase family protein [Defluviitaleaceae bacterium]